mmetsp:Transcript_129282/g.241777  ORF Transcript_129282/g.241777 Transcript_129282/m.241777 type:complete len:217 (+) Transcript_129282:3-653(+)
MIHMNLHCACQCDAEKKTNRAAGIHMPRQLKECDRSTFQKEQKKTATKAGSLLLLRTKVFAPWEKRRTIFAVVLLLGCDLATFPGKVTIHSLLGESRATLPNGLWLWRISRRKCGLGCIWGESGSHQARGPRNTLREKSASVNFLHGRSRWNIVECCCRMRCQEKPCKFCLRIGALCEACAGQASKCKGDLAHGQKRMWKLDMSACCAQTTNNMCP